MPTPSSQGATVSFNGTPIGKLTGIQFRSNDAKFEDWTNKTSFVLFNNGTGGTRVLKRMVCVAIEPGGVDIKLFGCPPFVAYDSGAKGVLTFAFSGGAVTSNAFLQRYEVTASVGEFLVGSASFQFSGD